MFVNICDVEEIVGDDEVGSPTSLETIIPLALIEIRDLLVELKDLVEEIKDKPGTGIATVI